MNGGAWREAHSRRFRIGRQKGAGVDQGRRVDGAPLLVPDQDDVGVPVAVFGDLVARKVGQEPLRFSTDLVEAPELVSLMIDLSAMVVVDVEEKLCQICLPITCHEDRLLKAAEPHTVLEQGAGLRKSAIAKGSLVEAELGRAEVDQLPQPIQVDYRQPASSEPNQSLHAQILQ